MPLKPTVEIFYEDNINYIIHECLTYPQCEIIIAVKNEKIKDLAQIFFKNIDPKVLAQRPRISTFRAEAIFTNQARLIIIGNNGQSRGYKASKIYCSPDTSVETYFYILKPQLLDYQNFLENNNICIKQ